MTAIDVIRVIFPDLLGIDRGRDVLAGELGDGVAFCRAIYHTSPRGDVVDVEGGLDAGLPDITIQPDLTTLRPLPWEPGVAWCLGDAHEADGSRCPEDPRNLVRRVVERFNGLGLDPIVGPELEYFLLTEGPNGWARYGDAPGDVYTAGRRGDPDGHLLATLRSLRELGLDVTAANHEFSGGQFEINLRHSSALNAADQAFLFKAAVKELARRSGLWATFMAKPFNDEGGSGFHVHLSCLDGDGHNAFDDPAGPHGLSATALHAIAGVVAHAPALAALLNPTINSYKRFGRDSLAPWLIDWGLDNRSAMVRIPHERGAGARLETRLGDASANPYVDIAGLLAAAYLGIRDRLEPPAPLDGYGYDPSRASLLPQRLPAALEALAADDALTDVLGKGFVDPFLAYKRNEVTRFERYVTDWEFGEYAYHL